MPASNQRVIIADDDSLILDLVRDALRQEKFEVSIFRDGQAALRAVRVQPPALVILDASMPVMDGYTALSALRADPLTKAIPVVMLTAKRSPGDVQRAMALGANGYVVKPFETRVLLARVRAAIAPPPAVTSRAPLPDKSTTDMDQPIYID